METGIGLVLLGAGLFYWAHIPVPGRMSTTAQWFEAAVGLAGMIAYLMGCTTIISVGLA